MKNFPHQENLNSEFALTDSSVAYKPNLHNDLNPFLLRFPCDNKIGIDCTDA